MMASKTEVLKDWFDGAEQVSRDNLPRKGDTIIFKTMGEDGYVVENTSENWSEDIIFKDNDPARILERAPRNWTNALAVLARYNPEAPREVFSKSEVTEGAWRGEAGWCHTDDLIDVTELVPLELTDEMIDHALVVTDGLGLTGGGDERDRIIDREVVSDILSAGLGLDKD